MLTRWIAFGRQGTQGFLSPVFKDQCDRLTKVPQTSFARLALAISSGHFGAVRDMPWTVLFDYRRELVAHVYILPLPQILTKVPATGVWVQAVR